MKSFHRRRYIVRLFKIICLLLLLILVSGVIIWPIVKPKNKRVFLAVQQEIQNKIGQLQAKQPVMQKPRFQGGTQAGEPYSISAVNAVQLSEEIALEEVYIELRRSSGDLVTLISAHGRVLLAEKIVHLPEEVDVFSSSGYNVYVRDVYYEWEKGILKSDQKIKGNGPLGAIEADRFYAEDQGQKIQFSGHVKIMLVPKKD